MNIKRLNFDSYPNFILRFPELKMHALEANKRYKIIGDAVVGYTGDNAFYQEIGHAVLAGEHVMFVRTSDLLPSGRVTITVIDLRDES